MSLIVPFFSAVLWRTSLLATQMAVWVLLPCSASLPVSSASSRCTTSAFVRGVDGAFTTLLLVCRYPLCSALKLSETSCLSCLAVLFSFICVAGAKRQEVHADREVCRREQLECPTGSRRCLILPLLLLPLRLVHDRKLPSLCDFVLVLPRTPSFLKSFNRQDTATFPQAYVNVENT